MWQHSRARQYYIRLTTVLFKMARTSYFRTNTSLCLAFIIHLSQTGFTRKSPSVSDGCRLILF